MVETAIPRVCTDEDLKAIKQDFINGFMDLGSNRRMMLALIARLEAAEAFLHVARELNYAEIKEWDAWRKTAGK